jgi:DNA-3-methyladenine glycosylase
VFNVTELDEKFVPLPEDFYEQPTLLLAKALLGCLLVKETAEGIAAGYIVETEAYSAPDDKAAHSYNNRRTARTEVMFQRSGLVYSFELPTTYQPHALIEVGDS